MANATVASASGPSTEVLNKRSKSLSSRLTVAASVVLAAVATGAAGNSALAQQAPAAPATQTDQPATQSDQLQEVVVTAERREANLQTTAISVSALSGQELTEEHLRTVSDLMVTVPNLSVETQGYFTLINIRGIGTNAISSSTLPGIAVIRDGVTSTEPVGNDVPTFDIADVEVLRGPQGTFVGASSTGGAIEINSVDPNFKGTNGYAQVQVGTYNDLEFQGAMNLPVNDTFTNRFAFFVEKKNSYFTDIDDQNVIDRVGNYAPGQNNTIAARWGSLWQPTSDFQVLNKVDYVRLDTDGVAAQEGQFPYTTLFSNGNSNAESMCKTLASGQLTCPVAGTLTFPQFYAQSSHSPFVLDYDEDYDVYIQTALRDSLQLRWTMPGGVVLRSLTGFQDIHLNSVQNVANANDNAGIASSVQGPDITASQEIDLLSPTNRPVTWIAGAVWYYRDGPTSNLTTAVPSPYLNTTAPTTETVLYKASENRNDGLFGNLDWQFMPTLQLAVGARENWDNNFVTTIPGGVPSGTYNIGPPMTLITASPTAAHYSDSVPTWKVGLNWTPTAAQFFYAFEARGYKSGGVNYSAIFPTFKPEIVNDYELGWKGRLLDGHLLTQLGGYWMNYQHFQQNLYDPADNQTEYQNLAASTVKGIEFSAQSRIGGWGMQFNFSYNNTVMGSTPFPIVDTALLPPGFNSPTPHLQCGAPGVAEAGCFDYTPYEANISGEQLPFAPEYTGSLIVDYAIPVGSGVLDPRVTYSYTAKQWASIYDIPGYAEMGARHLYSAQLNYIINTWEVQLYGTNLTNEIYLTDNTGSIWYYGAPRQLGVFVKKTF